MLVARTHALLLTASFLAACGTGAPAPADATSDLAAQDASADAPAPSDGSGGGTALSGVFQIQLVGPVGATPGYTSVVGRVQTSETPVAVTFSESARVGDCRLLVPRVPFCSTPCGSSAVCVADDTCRPYPTALSAGAVRVTGLRTASGSAPIDLTSVAMSYQVPGAITLSYPAFDEGGALRIEAAGAGTVPAFAVDGRGIAPLALGAGALTLQRAMPLELRWTAASMSTSIIKVKLDISHHGGTRGVVTCETADDGSLTVDASLVTGLLNLGVAGFPTIVVTRLGSSSSAVGAGRVNLEVSSVVETAVEVPGVRSCTMDSECDGGVCQPDLTCR